MKFAIKTLAATSFALGLLANGADAETRLRIQNHVSPDSMMGRMIKKFVDDVHTMSNGDIQIEMHYSAAVVKSTETFDAATTGILDCDMTNGAYQTGKNPAFQFVADTLGGYDTPVQYQSWVNFGGGYEEINKLYNSYGMTFIGGHVAGQESLNSTRPLKGIADLKGFKFRSPPGMQSEIFASLGASPIVMDFTEVFTALETGIVDGADASSLAVNNSIGLYDIAKHTTFPGFHSMAADHLACRTDIWDSVPENLKRIISVAHKAMSMDLILVNVVENGEAFASLTEQGVTTYDWSAEDRTAFRAAAQNSWANWAQKTPEAKTLVNSHEAFMKRIGLTN